MSTLENSASIPLTDMATGIVAAVPPLPKKSVRNRRVLHIINGEYYAGAERVQDLLSSRLSDFGYDVGFVCVKPNQFADCREFQKTPIHDLAFRSAFDPRAISQLRTIVNSHGYNIIHAHTPRSVVIARILARLENIPMVYHVHSPVTFDSTRPLVNRVKAVMERLSLWRVDKLIAVSNGLSEYMQSLGYSSDLITVVPNGVPIVSEIGGRPTPRGSWTLGTVALFRPRKGIEILLDSIKILRNKNHDVRLRAIGGFESLEYEASVKAHAKSLKIDHVVEWVGFQNDVNTELQKVDLFVLPSLFGEGMPMVILEAMANGVPPIGTRIDGIPEVIRNGVDGLIAKPGDATDLAHQLEKILNGEISWQKLRNCAIRRHAEEFSDASMARGVARVYNEVWQGSKHPIPV